MLHWLDCMLPIFYKLHKTLSRIYSIRGITWQLLACALTYIIVITNFDWIYFKAVQGTDISIFLASALGLGMLIPTFGLLFLYLFAKFAKHNKLRIISWALVQSASLGWIISCLYKVFTGRIQPPRGIITALMDSSHDWNFGLLHNGIFWGWPSSHTTVAFAMSCTLIMLFPKNKGVLLLALLYAFYIGIGVSMRAHWFSEFAAGAIIGSVIGIAVGKSFHSLLRQK